MKFLPCTVVEPASTSFCETAFFLFLLHLRYLIIWYFSRFFFFFQFIRPKTFVGINIFELLPFQLEILLQHCCTSSSSEKRHLRKILIGFVADTNSILKSDKNSVLVKRQIFILRTLIFKKLNEWMLDDDETFRYFTTVGWPENSISVPTCFDDGTFIQSWIIHLVSHQLRANSNLDELEELLKHCLLSQPVIAVAVLEIFLQPTSSYLEENHSICLLRDYFLILPTDEQNRIVGCVRKSPSICPFLNTFVRNCLAQKTYPFGGIRILSYLADSEFFASLTVGEIVSVCSMVGHDEEAFNAILDYVHRVLEFSVIAIFFHRPHA